MFTLNVMRIHLSMKTCTMVPGVYTNSVARAKCNISKPHTAPRDRFSTIDIMVLDRRGWGAIWWWRNGTIFFFPFFFQLHFQLHFQSNLFVFLAIVTLVLPNATNHTTAITHSFPTQRTFNTRSTVLSTFTPPTWTPLILSAFVPRGARRRCCCWTKAVAVDGERPGGRGTSRESIFIVSNLGY